MRLLIGDLVFTIGLKNRDFFSDLSTMTVVSTANIVIKSIQFQELRGTKT